MLDAFLIHEIERVSSEGGARPKVHARSVREDGKRSINFFFCKHSYGSPTLPCQQTAPDSRCTLKPSGKIIFFPASNEMTQLNRMETTAFYVEITVLRSLDFLLNLCLQQIFAF